LLGAEETLMYPENLANILQCLPPVPVREREHVQCQDR
jgi:hypothetical protein